MAKPSTRVHDTCRYKNGGNVEISSNSKPTTDDFHVDRSRIGTHEEWDDNAPNDWGGKGKVVPVPNSIMDNVRGAMGGLAARSSFNDMQRAECGGSRGCPTPLTYEPRPHNNPLMRKRGD